MSVRDENNEQVEQALTRAHRTHTGWRAQCPFCFALGHVDKKTSLQILGDGRWWCYRSSEHPEAAKGKLREAPDPSFIARAVIRAVKDNSAPKAFSPPDYFVELAGDKSEVLRPAREYLATRNVSPKAIKQLHLGACYQGKWAGRIIVPIGPDPLDVWYGWVGRLWRKPRKDAQGLSALKYLYPSGMEREKIIYNGHVLDRKTTEPAMLVEGAFDCFPFLDDAFAVLGKVSLLQRIRLANRVGSGTNQNRPIAVVLDGDAWAEGHALAMSLSVNGVRAGCVRLPPRLDPDEVDRDMLLAACRTCVSDQLLVKL